MSWKNTVLMEMDEQKFNQDKAKLDKFCNSLYVLSAGYIIGILVSLHSSDYMLALELSAYGVLILLYELYVLYKLNRFKFEYSISAPELCRKLERKVIISVLLCFLAIVSCLVVTVDMKNTSDSEEMPDSPMIVNEEAVKDARYSDKMDKRAPDYVMEDDALLIKSSNMRFAFPAGCEQLLWNVRYRSRYDFDFIAEHYRINFNIQVVYTIESSRPQEFYEEFVIGSDHLFDKGHVTGPTYIKAKDKMVFKASGKSSKYPEQLAVRYATVHKGSLLHITALIPSGKRALIKETDQAVKLIEFL